MAVTRRTGCSNDDLHRQLFSQACGEETSDDLGRDDDPDLRQMVGTYLIDQGMTFAVSVM